MTDLVEFLKARIGEDVAACEGIYSGSSGPDFQWGPDRIRAECAAKLQLLQLHTPENRPWELGFDAGEQLVCEVCDARSRFGEDFPCETLRLVAVPYADHIDFDPDWVIPRR